MRPPEEVGNDGPQAVFADINITPLTDVILVLLIIAMVTSHAMVDAARHQELPIALPGAAASGARPPPEQVLVVGLAVDGRRLVDGQVVPPAELARRLAEVGGRAPATPVVVEADGLVPHGVVVGLIDQIRAAGFTTVGLGTEEGMQPAAGP